MDEALRVRTLSGMVGGWCLNAEPSLMKDSLRSARLWIRDGGGSPIVKIVEIRVPSHVSAMTFAHIGNIT